MWVWVTALPKRLPQIPHDLLGFILQLPPSDVDGPVALGDKDAVALTIGLEALLRAVHAAAVELNRDLLLRPERVDLEDAATQRQVGVHPRSLNSMDVDKHPERLLEVVPREPDRLRLLQERSHVPSPAPPRIPLQQHRQRDPIPQLPHFRLMPNPLQLSQRQHGSE